MSELTRQTLAALTDGTLLKAQWTQPFVMTREMLADALVLHHGGCALYDLLEDYDPAAPTGAVRACDCAWGDESRRGQRG